MSATEHKQTIITHVRWMIHRDMPEVLDIEQLCFEFPWSDYDFKSCLFQRNCIGMVAEYKNQILGFMVYKLHKAKIYVLNFATHPDIWRRRIGSQMVAKLVANLSCQHRSQILLEVREKNLPAQLFFHKCGFRAITVFRNFYEETSEDAYLMQYQYKPAIALSNPVFRGNNRITSLFLG